MRPKTPYLSVDGIIKLLDENGVLIGIVFIERLNKPFGIALPGGFVDIGEKVENALIREMKEETNLDVKIQRLLGVYSDPNRDLRFHTVSCIFVCNAFSLPKAGDDAKEAFVVKLEEIPWDKLVFDHATILKDFLLN